MNYNSKQKYFAFITVVICIVIVLFLLIRKNKSTSELPKTILELHLYEEIKGDEARRVVNELHKKDIAPIENIIGKYQSSNGIATLYLSEYTSRMETEEQFLKMVNRIKEGTGAFTHFREINVKGMNVILCLGLGQAHYMFVSEEKLFWFAVDIPIAQATMQELIRIMKPAVRK